MCRGDCLAVATANGAEAQGVINFDSRDAGSCVVSNMLTHATAGIQSGKYEFGFYVGATMNEVVNSVTPVLTFANTSFPGVISSSTFTINALTARLGYFFQIRGWTAALGSTYEQVSFIRGATRHL